MYKSLTDTFHPKVEVRDLDVPGRTGLTAGVHQLVWCSWPGLLSGVAFIAATVDDRVNFGPGVFRVFKGEMKEELIARIDPWACTLEFVDNDLYVEHGVIRWSPIKCRRMLIADLPAFRDAWSEPHKVTLLLDAARKWFESTRHDGWSEGQHLDYPKSGTTGDEEDRLAEYTAKVILEDRHRHA